MGGEKWRMRRAEKKIGQTNKTWIAMLTGFEWYAP